MPFLPTEKTLDKDIKNLQSNFLAILTSNCHYNTSEITSHIKHINNALDNIKLDYEFQHASKSLAKQFDSDQMKLNETTIKELITKGNQLSQELNNKLHSVTIKNKEQNQVQDIHNWACDSLKQYLQNLSPHASSSYSRLDNVAHHLGVTDRYLGYRNNLTRNANQPINVHSIWADRKLLEPTTPDWKDWSRAFQHNGQSPLSNLKTFDPISTPTIADAPPTRSKKSIKSHSFAYANDYNSHLVKSGMNTNFPGISETTHRFLKSIETLQTPTLPIAQPDYTTTGRPLAHLVSDPPATEYAKSYTFPDSSQIERYPYRRP